MRRRPALRDAQSTPPGKPARRSRRQAALFAPLASRPIRAVLRWQLLAGAACALAALLGWGTRAGWSAALGAGITIASTVAYALMLGAGEKSSAAASVATMLRAEAVKIVVVIGGFWMALTRIAGVVQFALFATFVVTVLLFRVALLVRE